MQQGRIDHRGTPVRVWVTDRRRLAPALTMTRATLDRADRAVGAAPDSEVRTLAAALPSGVRVSETLRGLVTLGLQYAGETGGAYAPTAPAYGPDRGQAEVHAQTLFGARVRVVEDVPGWQRIALHGDELTVPAGVVLDLGPLARAVAADQSAARIARELRCGVLVAVGSDVATAGRAPEGGWQVTARDAADDPGSRVALTGGAGLATASTRSRRWRDSTSAAARLADPHTLGPGAPHWRTVSVAATTCARARAYAEATLGWRQEAVAGLAARGMEARLVDSWDLQRTTPGWPGAGVRAA